MHGSLCVFGTNPRVVTVSKNILPEKETVSNKVVNLFLNKFDDKIDTDLDYMPVDWKIYKYDNSELLEQNNFWKKLSRDLNQRGYELEVFMVDAMNIPAHRGPKARYCEFFVGATQNEDLMKQHKGKIGARSIGLLDNQIMNFCDFINEEKENISKDFIAFKGVPNDFKPHNNPMFFTSDEDAAKYYAERMSGYVITASIKFKNPLIVNADKPAPQ
jgi:hypothetical protein